MQTFLPYPDFAKSASVLDRQRLGKQRVEAYQILRALVGASTGWRNHPATKMWVGYEFSLAEYTIAMCDEWTRRGYKDSIAEKVCALVGEHGLPRGEGAKPPWMTNGDIALLCTTHRSNLLRKAPLHYRQFGWTEATDLAYYWPSSPFTLLSERTMTEDTAVQDTTENTATTVEPAANDIADIDLLIASQRANISDAIGEKAVARANKRLDFAHKTLVTNAKAVARQTIVANRPKRAPKTAAPAAEQPAEG